MYYPYFRGKQYELITVRESAEILSQAEFVPIIEPVKESLNGLKRAIDAVIDANGSAILIVNPHCGDHERDTDEFSQMLINDLSEEENIWAGMLLSDTVSIEDVIDTCDQHKNTGITLIHKGFTEARELSRRLGNLEITDIRHVFEENHCGKLYRRHFKDETRILLRDGFKKRTNRNHPPIEYFSDLHATYEDEGMDGFGDFLIVGDEFSTSGGPAYAVAIHLTFIDGDKDDAMYIYHFVSDTQDTPKNPAGKFAEALDKLVEEVERLGSKIYRTNAVNVFLQLHRERHFPGLGYVKKLSMNHHIETLAQYLDTNS